MIYVLLDVEVAITHECKTFSLENLPFEKPFRPSHRLSLPNLLSTLPLPRRELSAIFSAAPDPSIWASI